MRKSGLPTFLIFAALLFPAAANAQTQPYSFDVVSIRPNPSAGGSGFGFDAAGFRAINVPISQDLYMAYFPESNSNSIDGIPAWVTNDHYDVIAKISAASAGAWAALTPHERLITGSKLLQSMLADRCKLQAHMVPAKVSGYALVVSKSSSKLAPAKPRETYPPDARPFGSGAHIVPASAASHNTMHFYGASMSDLAQLFNILGFNANIQDRTNLTGRYDFDLPRLPPPPSTEQRDAVAAQQLPSDRWDLRALGLELRSISDIATINLVIDHIERPTPN